VEAAEALELMRKNCELFANAYWKQLAPGPELRRFFWSGKGQHRVFAEEENFSRYLRGKLKDCFLYRRPPPEAHGSLDLTLKPKAPVEFYRRESLKLCGWLAALDLDLREQRLEPDEAVRRFAEAVEFLYRWGIEAEIRLSGGGVHATFPLPPLEEPVAVNRGLAELLAKRFKLVFDGKVYAGEHHLMRLTFSWHKNGIFAVPLWPWELEQKWGELQSLASNPEEVVERLKSYGSRFAPLGAVAEPERFNALLRLLEPKGEPVRLPANLFRRRSWKKAEGWRVCEAPGLGSVEYSAELEGYGYLRALVERGVLLRDGKLNAAWLLLAPAVARGVLSEAEAEDWLRGAAEACRANPEPYLKKLREEVRRRVGKSGEELALPTWRSLLTKTKKDGTPLEDYYEAVRKPLLEALAEKGLVRLGGGGEG